ncbi:MAG TPA: cyclopropane-fatty-acyl-phospholipid synthase family protein [Gemmata sp.]
MSVPASRPTDPTVAATVRLLGDFTRGYAGNFGVRFWTGEAWQPGTGPAPFTLVLKHPGALRAMFWPFDRYALGESYIFDDFDIEGDMFAFALWLWHIIQFKDRCTLWQKLGLLRALLRVPGQKNPRDPSKAGRPGAADHSQATDQQAISFAYDLPSEFYCLFLDKNLQYTCGYFARPDEDLDTAQERKLDYVCKKLRLRPGEKFVDFGCGWGGLVIHAAKHYGVHATGVTLAGEQARWAQKSIDAAGVGDRVKIVLTDYREFRAPGTFDKASSVGMAEHVGTKNYPAFLGKIHECLKPGGVYLHHCITLKPNTPYPTWTPFALKYVFPNGDLQTVVQVQDLAAKAGFEIRDVENLREHYVHTLNNWVKRLEANRAAVVELVGEVSYRIFRIYMAGAPLGFRFGLYGLNQFLLAKPHHGEMALPLTRADWYTAEQNGPG